MIVIPVVDFSTVARARGSSGLLNRGDPAGSLREFRRYGFSRVHLRPDRTPPGAALASLPSDLDVQVQVAADIRRPEDVDELVAAGAAFVVVQPPALDVDSFSSLIALDPLAVIAAVNVCGRRIVCGRPSASSWTRHAADWIEELAHLGVAGVLVDQRDAQGRPARCDLTFLEDLVENGSAPILAAGLLERLGDLDALQDRGVSAVLLGENLEAGRIDPWAAAREFGA